MGNIVITGGTGLLGTAFKDYDAIRVSSKQYDLRNYSECLKMIEEHNADRIIHLASRVGGVKGNMDFVGDFFRDNTLINTNVLEAARVKNVKKVISILSTCIYPFDAPLPLNEVSLHNGSPHESNFGYAFSKRMLDVMSQAYRKQWGCNFITCVPNNLVGENDNFEKIYSHVAPALIRKMFEAKLNNINEVVLWGNGSPKREFTYSKDIAKIIMLLLEQYNEEGTINIGNTDEISIKELAGLIAKEIGYTGQIIWDESMPSGQQLKPSDNTKFKKLFPDFKYTPIEIVIKNTCEWFKKNYPNIRGI